MGKQATERRSDGATKGKEKTATGKGDKPSAPDGGSKAPAEETAPAEPAVSQHTRSESEPVAPERDIYQCGDLFRIAGSDELFMLAYMRDNHGCLMAVGPGTRMLSAPQKLDGQPDRLRVAIVNFLARGKTWKRVAVAADLAAFLAKRYANATG